MVTHLPRPAGWTGRHLRHIAGIFRQDQNPAARVYESIGTDFFLAPAPGWLNLGLWEGPGSEHEADTACRRLVQTVAAALPEAGVILDVGNGLGRQDPVIVEVLRPRRLVAVNITEWQLSVGRDRLREAAALGVAGDATRLPIADQSIDGVISVEAAFHFRSRRAFFDECFRVLKPGGVLSISDITTERPIVCCYTSAFSEWPSGPVKVASLASSARNARGSRGRQASHPAAVPAARAHDRRDPWLRTEPSGVSMLPLAGEPGHGSTAVLRRQPVRIVDGRFGGGYNDVFELICPSCGDHTDLEYSEVPPRLQRLRGPRPLEAALAASHKHLGLPWPMGTEPGTPGRAYAKARQAGVTR